MGYESLHIMELLSVQCVQVMICCRLHCAVALVGVVLKDSLVFVSLSVKLHLTFGASVHPEKAQQATEVEIFVGFSLKLLHSRAMAYLALYQSFSHCGIRACASKMPC